MQRTAGQLLVVVTIVRPACDLCFVCRLDLEQLTTLGQTRFAQAIAEQSVVADALESTRQDM